MGDTGQEPCSKNCSAIRLTGLKADCGTGKRLFCLCVTRLSPGWTVALFRSSRDLSDGYQPLKPVSFPSSSPAKDHAIIQLSKGTTHRWGSTLAPNFCFEPCNVSWLRHLPPRIASLTCCSGSSRAGCGLLSPPNTAPLFPDSTGLLRPLLCTHLAPLPPSSNSLHTSRPL